MNNLKKIGFLLVLFSLVFSSCSKDEDNSAPSAANSTSFTSADITAKLPASLSKKSPETSAQINAMIANMYLSENFQKLPASANRSNKTARGPKTWTNGEYTIIYSDSDSATQYLYTYTVKQGIETIYVIDGWENKDGSAGHWDLNFSSGFVDGDMPFTIDFDWIKNSSNSYNLKLNYVLGEDYAIKYIANINNDGSGDLDVYLNNELYVNSVWNSSGSGQYTDYSTDPATITKF